MRVLLSLLVVALNLAALNVKEDHALFKSGCSEDAGVIATLPAGAPLTIRFGLSGENTPCYKVSATVGGKTVEGYLPGSAIDGLNDFESGRRDAAWPDPEQLLRSIRAQAQLAAYSSTAGAGASGASGGSGQALAAQALADQAATLAFAGQPAKALALLEPALLKRPDPTLLAIAGVASWRADDSQKALEYLRRSLEISPVPWVEKMYHLAERETKGDLSNEKLFGSRVILRYDRSAVPIEAARQMVAALDEDLTRVSSQLGCSVEEKLVAVVQTVDAYRKTTDAAEWSGGEFDGRIRVQVLGQEGMDANMRRKLAHETVHACLFMLGSWPAWLHEGMAQRLSGQLTTAAGRKAVEAMIRQGKLPRLSNLRQDWQRMDTEHAIAAYALASLAVDLLYENYKEDGVRNLLRNPDHLPTITADLDQRLGL